jgi:hypothetical protein
VERCANPVRSYIPATVKVPQNGKEQQTDDIDLTYIKNLDDDNSSPLMEQSFKNCKECVCEFCWELQLFPECVVSNLCFLSRACK